MDKRDAQYLFLISFRDYIKNGYSKEILEDLKTYFPEDYETLVKAFKSLETNQKFVALLHASPV
jgi:hypothetical protein